MPFEITRSSEVLDISDGFLMLSQADCEACMLMKQSFQLLDAGGKLTATVISQEFQDEGAFSKAVMAYQIEDLPTLILFKDGAEIRRWKGFFDEPPSVAADKLMTVIDAASC